jgi:hypothetical protein
MFELPFAGDLSEFVEHACSEGEVAGRVVGERPAPIGGVRRLR